MKLAIRIFALTVVFAGFAAASFSAATTKGLMNHQSATSSFPVPGCGPHMCPPNSDPDVR